MNNSPPAENLDNGLDSECGTNSGQSEGVVWKNLPQGGPKGNDY